MNNKIRLKLLKNIIFKMLKNNQHFCESIQSDILFNMSISNLKYIKIVFILQPKLQNGFN